MALAAISMADKPPPHRRPIQRRPPPHLKRLAPRPVTQLKKVPVSFQRHAKKLRDPKSPRKPLTRPSKPLKPQSRQTVLQVFIPTKVVYVAHLYCCSQQYSLFSRISQHRTWPLGLCHLPRGSVRTWVSAQSPFGPPGFPV